MNSLFKSTEVLHPTVDGTNYFLTAGTSDVLSAAIDCANCDEIDIILIWGTMSGSSSGDAKLQESDASAGSYADLAGSAATQITASDSSFVQAWTVKRPLKQFLKVAIARGDGGNSVVQALIVLKHTKRKQPVTQAVTAAQFKAAPKFLVSPVAGTA